jgi:hypothetical protein
MHRGTHDAFFLKRGDFGSYIVTHEIEFVFIVLFSGVKGSLGGRQSKDEPAASCIDGTEAEHIAEEGSIGLGVSAIEDGVGAL